MSSTKGRDASDPAARTREIFCNRTLNLRSIRAIGYDMDYTLIHYRVEEWESRAFEHLQRVLAKRGWPVEKLGFDPAAFQRGLIIDRQLGHVIKANQFGYVKHACHGRQHLDFDHLRQSYEETIVDLAEERFVFLNTLFSLSEASMYAQLVDLLDAGRLPEGLGYHELYGEVKQALDETHMAGRLKAEIVADPERFVDLDPGMPRMLLDQRQAGKKLLLITNSEWPYTRDMMSYACDRYLPEGMTWRELFDVIVVSARKPQFFLYSQPVFEVVDEEGLLAPVVGLPKPGRILLGGHAGLLERTLDLRGSQFLYIGDHAYGDVHVSKNLRRWRTGLIVRELEDDIRAQDGFADSQAQLSALMAEKAVRELELSRARLLAQRAGKGGEKAAAEKRIARERQALLALDERITPLAQSAGELANRHWGLLMRSGNDRSFLARQVERHADIYMSRVSNFRDATPFAFFRPRRALLPHEIPAGERP